MANYPSERGFVLIATSIALVILLALAGVGIDFGRMYVIRGELQSFADAAAIAAASRLDGTAGGLEKARQAPSYLATGTHAMKWDMGTQPITDFATSFAKGDATPDAKTWQEAPQDASDCRFVRVVASARAPLIFLRAFEALQPDTPVVAAASVAVKSEQIARLVQ